MSYFETYVLGKAANEAAKEVVTNYSEEKRRAFLMGAEWAARYFLRQLEVHPMEDAATKKYLDGIRIGAIEEALVVLLRPKKEDPNG